MLLTAVALTPLGIFAVIVHIVVRWQRGRLR